MNKTKAFFITNVENKNSFNTGKSNVARVNDFGNFKAEIFEGVKGSAAYPIFKQENIKFLNKKYHTEKFAKSNKVKNYEKQTGAAGCFASHYLLWKKCVELNETIGIFEYDAKQCRIIPKNIKFENLLHLGGWVPKTDQDGEVSFAKNVSPYEGYSRWGYRDVMMACYSYMLKPHAAKILIETTKEKGWLPVDRFVSTDIVNMKKEVFSPYIFLHPLEPKQSLSSRYDI